jgi:hypothetical protein
MGIDETVDAGRTTVHSTYGRTLESVVCRDWSVRGVCGVYSAITKWCSPAIWASGERATELRIAHTSRTLQVALPCSTVSCSTA